MFLTLGYALLAIAVAVAFGGQHGDANVTVEQRSVRENLTAVSNDSPVMQMQISQYRS
jgi:hypothetical protein